jgi:hypothetical protein
MPLKERFKKLIECLNTVHDDGGIDCMTAGVDFDCLAEQAAQGADIHVVLPKVAAHIDCCPDCREEYEALVAIIAAEQENSNG